MKIKLSRSNPILWLGTGLLLAVFFTPLLPAQSAAPSSPGRYLFIFDTSANMKKRLPGVQKTVATLLATGMGGQLRSGDTLGVWTFNQELHPGDFPLQVWDPDATKILTTNLVRFIGTQKFAGQTRFEALQPPLNRVMLTSERLTVIIFSDGATEITGTTFNLGINKLFEQNAATQKKTRQPFVVVLRSQMGKYIGCTVSWPPQPVNFPEFPPLPEPPPAPKPAPAPAAALPAPAVMGPSMFITGTNIEFPLPPSAPQMAASPSPVIESIAATIPSTNALVNAAIIPANPSPQILSAPPQAPTNAAIVMPAIPLVTAVPVTPIAVVPPPSNSPPPAMTAPINPIAPPNSPALLITNQPSVKAQSSATSNKPLLIGAIFLAAAGLLAVLAVIYFRRPDDRSLISRSMHDP